MYIYFVIFEIRSRSWCIAEQNIFCLCLWHCLINISCSHNGNIRSVSFLQLYLFCEWTGKAEFFYFAISIFLWVDRQSWKFVFPNKFASRSVFVWFMYSNLFPAKEFVLLVQFCQGRVWQRDSANRKHTFVSTVPHLSMHENRVRNRMGCPMASYRHIGNTLSSTFYNIMAGKRLTDHMHTYFFFFFFLLFSLLFSPLLFVVDHIQGGKLASFKN